MMKGGFMHPKYNETIDELRTWAHRERNIQCVLILGSQVRKEFGGDEWSDLDVLLFADDPDVFIQTDTWVACFGEIVCVTFEETILDWIHLRWYVKRVLFADNRAIDFSIMPYNRIDDVLSINAEIHAQGNQVIYDAHPNMVTSKIETTLATFKEVPTRIPTEDDVHQTIHDLLFQLIWACKKIKRNELWVAVRCINHHFSNRLLQLIESYTASIAKTSQSIKYDGRFLERRINQDIIEKLPQCFAKYDAYDAIQTIHHLIDITYYLSKDICENNNYPFNQNQFDIIRKLYGEMFANESW